MPIIDREPLRRMDNLDAPKEIMGTVDNDRRTPNQFTLTESENINIDLNDLSNTDRNTTGKTDGDSGFGHVITDKHEVKTDNLVGERSIEADTKNDNQPDKNIDKSTDKESKHLQEEAGGSQCVEDESDIPLDGKSTDRSESVLSDIGGIDSDTEEVLAALQSIKDNTENDLEEESESGTQLSDVFGTDEGEGEEIRDNQTTPLAELGLATKTLTELNFTWNSSLDTSALGTLDTHCSPGENQYFQGAEESDVEADNKMDEPRRDDLAFANPVTGVTFDSRTHVYIEPIKEEKKVTKEEDDDDFPDIDIGFTRNASRLALESREAMYRRAMSLLSARCTSVKQDQAESGLPFGIQTPKYFYVTQDKPLPMEPLKAWKGYHGNVYFEPIHINHLKVDEAELLRARTSVPRTRQRLTAKLSSQQEPRLAITDKENKVDNSRSESRQTTKSAQSNASTRQMAVLDRQAITTRFNENIYEDMVWIEGQENTGSLAVRPRSHPDQKAHDRDLQYNKERIKKGSVVHKLYEEKKAKHRPRLTVSGGKFTPPTSMSPLLRTQTQYSLSQRLTTNSPDPYHGHAKLPPLDHLRASLKHMDSKAAPVAKGYSRAVTLTDEMKPFVKYSHDVMVKFAQQAAL